MGDLRRKSVINTPKAVKSEETRTVFRQVSFVKTAPRDAETKIEPILDPTPMKEITDPCCAGINHSKTSLHEAGQPKAWKKELTTPTSNIELKF
mmetsp:Transcript_17259/g.22745  ORF Transcript_17259/g.22745 Transcript_17259/m.22745 type:complete len:94 (-) Transcript_17259:542-823(-)